MKKVLFFAAILMIGFVACSNDDDYDSFDFDRNLLYGTWRVTHIQSATGNEFIDITTPITEPIWGVTTATFNRNGTYSAVGFFGTGSGTFRTTGNLIITYVGGSEFFRYEVISLTGNNTELRLHESGSSESIRIRATRQ